MKVISNYSRKLGLVMMMAVLSLVSFAQEKKVDVDLNINKDSGNHQWYMSPVVWVIGGAIFILLLVALLRGNKSD